MPKHLWVKTAKNIKQNDELEAQKLENLNICKYLTSITITITILNKKNQFWWILAVDWMLTDRIGCTVGDPLSLRGTSHQFRWVSLIAADCTLNCHVLKRIKKKAFVYLVFQNLGLHASASSSSSYFERCHVARLLFFSLFSLKLIKLSVENIRIVQWSRFYYLHHVSWDFFFCTIFWFRVSQIYIMYFCRLVYYQKKKKI